MSNYHQELEWIINDRFARYAKYIIQERALPDVRDGLKPVQRRILYAMHNLGMLPSKPYKKSARIVGEVIGKYHPHGDTAIYDALVRMAQPWKINFPLIDMHGNKGSIDDDPPAAMRYTEARLSPAALPLLFGLTEDTVEWSPNFDDSEIEPTVLPSWYPNLIVNGATGIAAGYATNIPGHNFNEVIDALVHRLNYPVCNLKEIMQFIQGPDFPTGGIIEQKKSIYNIYTSGHGKIILKARMHQENNSWVITEIPYETVKQDIVKKINDLVLNDQIYGLTSAEDFSDRQGMQIVVRFKPNIDPQAIRKALLKLTPLQINYNVNMVAIKNHRPERLSLLSLLDGYIAHAVTVLTRQTNFQVKKAKKRLEIIEGLIKAISILDQVIQTIRQSTDRNNAETNLQQQFGFSPLQAEAIVQLRLYRLTSTDISALKLEKNDLTNTIGTLTAILTDTKVRNQFLINKWLSLKAEFDQPRRTALVTGSEDLKINLQAKIKIEETVIIASRDGYLQRLSPTAFSNSVYREWKHKPGDIILQHYFAMTNEKLILITADGNYLPIPIHKIANANWKENGAHINTIISLTGAITCVGGLILNQKNENKTVLIVTKKGLIKKVAVADLSENKVFKPYRIIKLNDDDEIARVSVIDDETTVSVVTANGYAATYPLTEISVLGLNARGIKALNLKPDDQIVGVFAFKPTTESQLLLINHQGEALKLLPSALPITNRNVRGINLIKQSRTNKKRLIFAGSANTSDRINILTKNQTWKNYRSKTVNLTTLQGRWTVLEKQQFVAATVDRYFQFTQLQF